MTPKNVFGLFLFYYLVVVFRFQSGASGQYRYGHLPVVPVTFTFTHTHIIDRPKLVALSWLRRVSCHYLDRELFRVYKKSTLWRVNCIIVLMVSFLKPSLRSIYRRVFLDEVEQRLLCHLIRSCLSQNRPESRRVEASFRSAGCTTTAPAECKHSVKTIDKLMILEGFPTYATIG